MEELLSAYVTTVRLTGDCVCDLRRVSGHTQGSLALVLDVTTDHIECIEEGCLLPSADLMAGVMKACPGTKKQRDITWLIWRSACYLAVTLGELLTSETLN